MDCRTSEGRCAVFGEVFDAISGGIDGLRWFWEAFGWMGGLWVVFNADAKWPTLGGSWIKLNRATLCSRRFCDKKDIGRKFIR